MTYMLLNENVECKRILSKSKISFIKTRLRMFGAAAANVHVKRMRAAGLCRRENRATYAFTSAL